VSVLTHLHAQHRLLVLVLVGLVFGRISGAAGTQVADEASLSGRVIDITTGQAVADAQVTLRPTALPLPAGSSGRRGSLPGASRGRPAMRSSLSGTDGAFSFSGLAGGTYTLMAARGGYLTSRYGQTSPMDGGSPLELRNGERLTGLSLQMWKGSVVSGTVQLSSGGPVAGRPVEAVQLLTTPSGGVVLRGAAVAEPTDDRGAYRLGPLPPGRFLIRVSSRNIVNAVVSASGAFSAATGPDAWDAFHPNASLPAFASVVELGIAEDRVGIDVRLPDRARYVPVSGRIGQSLTRSVKVSLVSDDNGPEVPGGIEFASTTAEPDGSFVFQRVPPGTYMLRGIVVPAPETAAGHLSSRITGSGPLQPPPDSKTPIAPLPTTPVMWFSERLFVADKPLVNLAVSLRVGSRVSGKLVLDPQLQLSPTELLATAVHVRSASGWSLEGLPAGRFEADGTFTTPALPDGRYSVMPYTYGDWFGESVVSGVRDLTGVGIELAGADVAGLHIAATRRRAFVVGTVRDAAGKTTSAAICYFPADRRDWLLGTIGVVAPDVHGQFRIPLAAGTYSIVALAGNLHDDWRTPRFLETLQPLAIKVQVGRGETVTRDLKTIVRK
jgi:hypothetical protein